MDMDGNTTVPDIVKVTKSLQPQNTVSKNSHDLDQYGETPTMVSPRRKNIKPTSVHTAQVLKTED